MEKLAAFVRICVTFVNCTSDSAISLVTILLDLNYRIVSLLANLIFCLYGMACGACSCLFVVIKCLGEDFVVFAKDVASSLVRLSNGMSSIIVTIASSLYDFISALINAAVTLICLPYSMLFLVGDFLSTVSNVFAYVGCTIKDYLALAYSSVVLLVMVIPQSMQAAVAFINNGLVQFTCSLKYNVKHLYKLIIEKYNSWSYDAAIGFFVIVLFCFTCYRLPKLLKHCHFRITTPSLILKVPSVLRKVLTKISKCVAYYWTAVVTSRSRKPRVGGTCNEMSSECLQEQLARELENKLCVVCQDSPKSIILLPCRHVCVCHTCRMTLLQNGSTCPMCRTNVQESMHVFL